MGHHATPQYIVYIFTMQEDGHLAIEDAGAKVPLDLSEAKLASGFLTGARGGGQLLAPAAACACS